MKKILALLLATLMLLSFVACGGSKSVVGKWVFGGTSFDFKDDNTEAQKEK